LQLPVTVFFFFLLLGAIDKLERIWLGFPTL
jgi:hypothetical protein